ncbi:MAG: HlyC/CorC family transporter [Acidobacteria bacterium]|nr:HlyC/CorC family transporter [Acidobacteriota bacterium]
MESDQYLELTLAVVLLTAITLYSILENALARMSRVDIKLLVERLRKPGHSPIAEQLSSGKYRVLIPVQLFLQVLIIALSLVLYLVLQHWLTDWILLVTVTIMVLILLILRHFIPWFMCRNDCELMFLRLLPFFRPFYRIVSIICFPVLRFISARQNGLPEPDEEEEEITEEEVQAYLDIAEEEGIFEQEESRMIQQIVEFGDTIVREIVMPRTEIVAIPHTATKEELKNLIVQSRHSRIPVFQENIDSILGVAYVRHLLANYSPERMGESIEDVIRPALFVPETKKILDLFREMQTQGEQMAIVVDEYGGVAGLVTLEDLLEEIVGEIRDEDQVEEIDIHHEGEDSYLMNGDTELDDIEQTLGVALYEEGYNTIAGIIIKHLGRFPTQDEIIILHGFEIQILDVDSRKVRRVRVRKIHGNTE